MWKNNDCSPEIISINEWFGNLVVKDTKIKLTVVRSPCSAKTSWLPCTVNALFLFIKYHENIDITL